MEKTERPRLTLVLDEATLRNMASLEKALEACFKQLRAQGVQSFDEASTHLCAEMVRKSSLARRLILRQPPQELLGYLWSTHFVSIMGEVRERGGSYRPDKNLINDLQFVLEFVHAAWSCSAGDLEGHHRLDQIEVSEILATLIELRDTAMLYCMAKARGIATETGNKRRADMSFRAMAAWVTLRGRRYQVLEEEFLTFVLRPHDDALRKWYGMGAKDIAAGIQAIANSTRTGLSDAVDLIGRGMRAAHTSDRTEGVGSRVATELGQAMDDLLWGGICNLSRHTDLTRPLLEDLSYIPGANTEFLRDGELRGTPLRTLPSLVKPGIRLGDDYYITDGQFVRDVAYRCIQRGLLARDPGYREEWNIRQKRVIEGAFTRIFGSYLKGAAATHSSVYFREAGTGNWSETDLVIVVEDVLVVVEAKAGVMAMESPAEDFDRYMASVERLIVNSYRQCERFVNYVASAETVPIYALRQGKHVEVGELNLADFRTVLPIGLTVESLSPFSTCLTSLDTIAPLLGKHVFMSMSVDDLLVLRRFLPTAGELLHYLEVRQQAGSVPDTTLLDESEYLGAYIARSRFDADLREQRKEAPSVVWNSFADIIDEYFEGENAGRGPVPRQNYPAELKTVLKVLDRKRPKGWLEMDSVIRNLGGEERDNLSRSIAGLKATLGRHHYRRILSFNGMPLQVWICASERSPLEKKMRFQAEVACLATEASRTHVLRLVYKDKRKLSNAVCTSFAAPCKSRSDYEDLERQAAVQRTRAVSSQDLARVRWD